MYEDTEKFIILVTGGRGCERPDQEVIMADLSIKQIKDIKAGDKVMGDDGTPRNVLSTCHGYSDMYRVHQTNAEDYYVNDAHIISIRKGNGSINDGRFPDYPDKIDINVKEFSHKNKSFRERWYGYKAGTIPYPEQKVDIEPYMLGVWLGDGTSIFPQITTPDEEIKEYLNEYASRNNLKVVVNGKRGKAEMLRLKKNGGLTNPFLDKLRKYDLVGNKHIPQEYISNSERVRLELLAGLLDTDGYMVRNGYEITQKNYQIARQVKYIADTLGFKTSLHKKTASINGKDCGIVYRVHINGDVWRIPCRIERKKVYPHKRTDWSVSLLSVEPIGEGEWYGIHLDGNQRYLHSDGTVTHNSGKSFNAGTFIERLTFDYNKAKKIAHKILFTRYTMVSASISVIPEFTEKIDLDEVGQFFHKSGNDVTNTMTGSVVMFRGIHTSSGNQTAKLKSIHGITTFVVDEAEEWVSEDEFEKIMLSIRTKGLQNRVIIIMNPCDSNHWVYKRFIKDTHKIVEYDGVPVQISTHPNVLHIHTTYLDNLENLSEQFLAETRDMKEKNPERYAHIVMGQWADVAEGAVFKKWGIVDEFPDYCKKVARAMDFGYSCFRGDTLITTMRGDIPIKDVKEGDYVLTRKGFRRVRNRLYNGVKSVTTKEFLINGTKYQLSATEEHNINVNGKWKKYGELTEKDRLCVLCPTKVLNTEDIQTENTQTIISTRENSYITQFTKTISEKSRKVWLYTIKILIRSIMILVILLQLLHLSILRFICTKKRDERNPLSMQEKSVLQKITGIKEGIKSIKVYQKRLENADNVEQSLFQQMYINDSVRKNAITNGSTLQKNVISNWFVSIAEKLSWVINTSNQKLAQRNVHINSHGITQITILDEEKCDVYDLEIEGVHEYFANGILVHNCDPTAIVRCGIVGNKLYLDELCYRTAMSSGDIIRELRQEEQNGDDGFVYSESADPRLIDEIALGGIIIYPVVKSAGSILAGLSKMHDMEIYVTKRSLNLQDELRNYVYAKDKFGNYTNMPEDHDNHLLDSARYYVLGCIEGKVMQPKVVTKADLGVY